jgi:hypothetical protein
MRLSSETVAVSAAAAAAPAPPRPFELTDRSRDVFPRTLNLRVRLNFGLSSNIGPAEVGDLITGRGVGLAGTRAAGNIAGLARAVMMTCPALTRRLRFQSARALRLMETLTALFGVDGPEPLGLQIGEPFGGTGVGTGALDGRLAGAFRDDLALAAPRADRGAAPPAPGALTTFFRAGLRRRLGLEQLGFGARLEWIL